MNQCICTKTPRPVKWNRTLPLFKTKFKTLHPSVAIKRAFECSNRACKTASLSAHKAGNHPLPVTIHRMLRVKSLRELCLRVPWEDYPSRAASRVWGMRGMPHTGWLGYTDWHCQNTTKLSRPPQALYCEGASRHDYEQFSKKQNKTIWRTISPFCRVTVTLVLDFW